MEEADRAVQNALIYGTEKMPVYKLATTTEMTPNSTFLNDSYSIYSP